MRRVALLAVLIAAVVPAVAQTPPPFSMAPERPAATPTAPATVTTPPATVLTPTPQTSPPAGSLVIAPATPAGTPGQTSAAPAGSLVIAPSGAPATPAAPAATTGAATVIGAAPAIRPLVPFEGMTLRGEYDSRGWAIYLTPEQAASPATLHLGYLNALLVAPEISNLLVLINDRAVVTTPLASSTERRQVATELPAGLLQPGLNRIRIIASQRHRTDCTVESTFDLWTEIDPDETYLSFAAANAAAITRIADLRAVGVDKDGLTTLTIVLPAIEAAQAANEVLELVQALSLRIQSPSLIVRVVTQDPRASGPGVLTVLLGTAGELAPFAGQHELQGPTTGFLTGTPGPTLLVTGRDWAEVTTAVESLTAPLRDSGERHTLSTLGWTYPDAPILQGGDRLTLAQLGIETTEFSGRRFRTTFTVGMPADLYAQAYGFVTLLLDGAYAAEVLPGGHVDIYVNGKIATTTPIVSRGGGIFRHLDVEVPLRQFEPGPNLIEIEAILPTAADAVCLPGATGSTTPRFVLFDSTELYVPPFARAAQVPDLAALSGMGFPLAESPVPVPVVLGRMGELTYSAAATFIARVAQAAGHPFAVELVTNPTSVTAPYGLYVGAVGQLPAGIGSNIGLSDSTVAGWLDPELSPGAPAALAPDPNNDDTLARWRDALSEGGGWRGQVSSFDDWLQRVFDLSLDNLLFGSTPQLNYRPPEDSNLLLMEAGLGNGRTSWTVLASPSRESLQAGTEALVKATNWRAITGQATVYRPLTGGVENVALTGADIMLLNAATPDNLRLVATNWLSKNLLIYGGLLVGLCILLGFATSRLLKSTGRQ